MVPMTNNLFPLPYWAPALQRVPIPLQVLNEAYLCRNRPGKRVLWPRSRARPELRSAAQPGVLAATPILAAQQFLLLIHIFCEVSPAAISASTQALDSLGPLDLKHISRSSEPIAYSLQKLS